MIMEAKINIAEILKDKPQGTKFYSILSDEECFLNEVSKDSIHVDINGRGRFWCLSAYGSTYSFPNGCVLLFPSREMRDWDKFSWRKGDVLTNSRGIFCIFKEFSDYPYTTFIATFVNNVDFVTNGSIIESTQEWNKASNENAEKYIGYITADLEKANRRLNLETLEIEKLPEFKDGDIVVYGKSVAICRKIYKHTLCFYVSLNEMFGLLFDDEVESFEEYRFATEEEKQQLFEALAKKGKAWDAEKKQIVDLKSKIDELKPFDKVLVRNRKTQRWNADLFGFKSSDGVNIFYHCVCTSWNFCIPYEGNESLLGTTKDVEG